jgi:hypothetical protein
MIFACNGRKKEQQSRPDCQAKKLRNRGMRVFFPTCHMGSMAVVPPPLARATQRKVLRQKQVKAKALSR